MYRKRHYHPTKQSKDAVQAYLAVKSKHDIFTQFCDDHPIVCLIPLLFLPLISPIFIFIVGGLFIGVIQAWIMSASSSNY